MENPKCSVARLQAGKHRYNLEKLCYNNGIDTGGKREYNGE